MIQNVRFAAHVNGVFTNARFTPQEASIVDFSTGSSCLTTFDTTNIYYTWLDNEYNKLHSEETTKIPFPFKGEMCLEEGKTLLRKLFFNKDGSRNSSVAVIGLNQKNFFMSCGLKAVDMWSDMNLDLIPGNMDHKVLKSFSLADNLYIYIVKLDDKIKIKFSHFQYCAKDDESLTLPLLTWQYFVDWKNTVLEPVQEEPVILNNSLIFTVKYETNDSFFVIFQKILKDARVTLHSSSTICILKKTQWQKLYLIRKYVTQCIRDILVKDFKNNLSLLLLDYSNNSNDKDETIELKLVDSMYEISYNHFKTSIEKFLDCNIWRTTLNNAKKVEFYRDLAWCDMDFQQMALEFISKNEHRVDYMKQFLLDKEHFKNFTKKVETMYLTNSKQD
ncbi:hypothetical protein NPIL_489791 [Nephila pilipes]|uniref:Uncharacterized protein n=1 Tax=Nephila pilipes TaxID=299642 RepID=A0A8X6NGZ3_NEPPI|nr:hypothetical protein NPIL_489791 [Nephila pilipes]